MITKDNLSDLLHALGFLKRDNTFSKTIGAARLEVNFLKGEITHPAGLTVNQKPTCNLNANENFVVRQLAQQ